MPVWFFIFALHLVSWKGFGFSAFYFTFSFNPAGRKRPCMVTAKFRVKGRLSIYETNFAKAWISFSSEELVSLSAT